MRNSYTVMFENGFRHTTIWTDRAPDLMDVVVGAKDAFRCVYGFDGVIVSTSQEASDE